MKNAIKEYIELNEKEKKELWERATFVFDTNVFLNLYRYSNKTRNQLLNAFRKLNDRVWMPYQVAYEFCKDRYKVINEVNSRFDGLSKQVEDLITNLKKELRIDEKDSDVEELKKYLEAWMIKKKTENYKMFDLTNDEVFLKLLELFDKKTGEPFSADEKKIIEKDGTERYAKKVPPGYKDEKKDENRFGDLFVWNEILKYAEKEKVDIIFVTHDQKDDWWNKCGGKTIGPRIELRKEFLTKTGKLFHMYSMIQFLSFFVDDEEKSIDKTTVSEVELFDSIMKKRTKESELRRYYDSIDDEKSRKAAKLRFEIARLEKKNQKRRTNIHCLEKKKMEGTLSFEGEFQLQRNRENIEKESKRIKYLKEKLSDMENFA